MTLNLLIAFAGGFISFLSPCVLPLIPGYVAYISGGTLNEGDKRKLIILKAVFFSLGFSIVFISFGMTASLVGKFFINYTNQLRIVAGLIIILKRDFPPKEISIEYMSLILKIIEGLHIILEII